MLATTKFPAEQESRIEWWGRVILRQQAGRIPLAQFCRQLGITTRKFYYWRQRLQKLEVAGESDHDNRRTSDQDNRWFAPCAAGGLSYYIAA
jgi:hypothetical protein